MSDITSITPVQRRSGLTSYLALLKPRVMSLVIFTATVGAFAAPTAVDPLRAVLSLAFIAIGAGASGALNMWWDADIDTLMRRTRNRPVPNGAVSPRAAMVFGLVLSVLSVVALWAVSNALAAGLLAFTIFFYAVIYTMILKRRTPQNIVIGGAAGAFPPMIGWAAATGAIGIESLMLFGLIFFWTPPHFWALALYMHDDYTRAGVPMLTVTHGRAATRRRVLAYSVVLAIISMAIAISSIGGPIFLTAAVVLNIALLRGAILIAARNEDTADADRYITERRFFRLTLYYLFILFASVWLEAARSGQPVSENRREPPQPARCHPRPLTGGSGSGGFRARPETTVREAGCDRSIKAVWRMSHFGRWFSRELPIFSPVRPAERSLFPFFDTSHSTGIASLS